MRKNLTDEKLFQRILSNKSWKAIWLNIHEMRSRPTINVFNKFIELSHSNNSKEREIAVLVLSQLGIPPRPFIKQTLNRFFELLKTETDVSVIGAILFGIGHNNECISKNEVEILCTFKDRKEFQIRDGLTFALGGVNDSLAIETLIYLTNDKSKTIRDWATFGIGTLTDRNNTNIKNALWKRVHDKDPIIRQEAIFGLAKRKDPRIKEILIKEIATLDNYSSLILEAIEEYEDTEFLDLLTQKLKVPGIENQINREWIKDCIGNLAKKVQ